MSVDSKALLPLSPTVAYVELVRMGMPDGEGFSEKTFQKYYKRHNPEVSIADLKHQNCGSGAFFMSFSRANQRQTEIIRDIQRYSEAGCLKTIVPSEHCTTFASSKGQKPWRQAKKNRSLTY
jgi:hypothetical protein